MAKEKDGSTISAKPIVLTKFERLGKGHECDAAEGFFTRGGPDWVFEVYFDDEPSEDTYKGTRISEMYIKCGGTTQWTWHSAHREEPGWDYGKLLFADFLAGIESAIQNQLSNNMQYCLARVYSVVDYLLAAGIDRSLVVSAMSEGLKRARGDGS